STEYPHLVLPRACAFQAVPRRLTYPRRYPNKLAPRIDFIGREGRDCCTLLAIKISQAGTAGGVQAPPPM
ncbi:unnamed protein product, partial [Ectocarpus sp. 6 AP-2014]